MKASAILSLRLMLFVVCVVVRLVTLVREKLVQAMKAESSLWLGWAFAMEEEICRFRRSWFLKMKRAGVR